MGPTHREPTVERPRRGLAARLGGSRMARETSWALLAELVRMVTQLAAFLLITNLFDARDYGIYVGALGLLSFAGPFATFGATYLMLRRIAGDGMAPSVALGRAVTTVLTGALVTVPVLALLQSSILPQASVTVLVTIAITEIAFGGIQELAVFVSQATYNLRVSVPIRLAAGCTRLAGLVVLWALDPTPSLNALTLSNLGAALAATGISLWLLRRTGVRVGHLAGPKLRELRDGLPYAVGFGADKLRDYADTVMLLRFDKQVDAGIYGTAGRLVDLTVIPLRSLVHASNARLFQAGRDGARAGRRAALRIACLAAAYAVPAATVMSVFGPTIIKILPTSYADAGQAVRLLALWPVAAAIELFAATALTAINHHRIRVLTNLFCAALNIGLNLLWIPDHGWRGSVSATLISSFTSSAIMWTALVVLGRREARRDAAQSAELRPIARR